MKLTIWRVTTGDLAWENESHSYLLSGRNAAAVERKAIKLHKALDSDLLKRERRHRPYVRSAELIGTLAE